MTVKYQEFDRMQDRIHLNIREDKLRINIIQLVVFAVIIPAVFSLTTPITEYSEEARTGFFAIFFKSEHYNDIINELDTAAQRVQQMIDRDFSAGAGSFAADSFRSLFLGSILGSLYGGLCISLCFYLWKQLTSALYFLEGVWPFIPAAVCSYIGNMILYSNEQGTDTHKILYGLIAANAGFIVFRCIYYRTSFIWQIVKGIFIVPISCVSAGTFSCTYCLYVMLRVGQTYGISSNLLIFAFTGAAWILVIIGDLLCESAERDKSERLL